MKTVHIILNAHLDPIWLWSWRDGVDEVLNTGYYICNLLDRHPDIIYTRGEAWVYQQIKRLDPALFARIQEHVRAGRWSLVGGWYLQPDCNLPSGFALERQIALGREFFEREFGQFPSVGYNVDSFGHAAALPGYMRAAGQSAYVMMRPQEPELTLPARLFRWRGHDGGLEVATFRIAGSYCTPDGMVESHVHGALPRLPEGVSHTMCFVGIGDHGGGPTEQMIEWCRAHRDALSGIRIEFSSPARFFAAIAPEMHLLPLVTGELQNNSIGCYSVMRSVKTMVRKAEHRLVQAEAVAAAYGGEGDTGTELRKAWETVCFHHFHDTLGGMCLPSSYVEVHEQLGQALAMAEEISTYGLRRHLTGLGEDAAQRLVFFNASAVPFSDYVEIEPWLEWSNWQPSWRLWDEKRASVPYQTMTPESTADNQVRLLFPLTVQPGECKVLRIVAPDVPDENVFSAGHVTVSPTTLQGPACSVDLGAGSVTFPGVAPLSLPAFSLLHDPTDTWSHGVKGYRRDGMERATWLFAEVVDQGPAMASLVQKGSIGKSELQAEWRVYSGKPWVECQVRVVWNEKHRLLKLDWKMPGPILEREDGVMGGSIRRKTGSGEMPLRDWTLMHVQPESGGFSAAMIAPDVFGIDGDGPLTGLTLLRSPVMACHEPNPGTHPRAVFSDRGEHVFRFRFWAAKEIDPARLDAVALAWHRPLLTADLTRGMKTRLRGVYLPTRS